MGEGFNETTQDEEAKNLSGREQILAVFELGTPVVVSRGNGDIETDRWTFLTVHGDSVRVGSKQGETKDVPVAEFLRLNHEHFEVG